VWNSFVQNSGGVFSQAFGFEALARKLASRKIAIARVNLIEPAFVFPGAGPDPDIPRRQRSQSLRKLRAIESGGFVK